MKKYLLLIILLINTQLTSQTLNGFLGIKWKSIKPQVKLLMLNIEDVELIDEDSDLLEFTGGKFAENNVKLWSFQFYNDFFFNVEVLLDTTDGEDSAIWYRVLNYLQDTHGKTKEFEKLDRNKTAILWYFYNEKGDLENLIQLTRTIRDGLESEIEIIYTYIPIWLKKEALNR